MAVDRSGAHEPELLEQHLVGTDELREKLGRDTSYTVAKNTLIRIAATV